MDIWKYAIEILDELLDIADELERKKLYRFAEQFRSASLSICNNIAEGAGSQTKAEFKQFLGYSRRSAFEVANMLVIFAKRKYISEKLKEVKIVKIEELCKMISGFIQKLRR